MMEFRRDYNSQAFRYPTSRGARQDDYIKLYHMVDQSHDDHRGRGPAWSLYHIIVAATVGAIIIRGWFP